MGPKEVCESHSEHCESGVIEGRAMQYQCNSTSGLAEGMDNSIIWDIDIA